MTNPLLVTDKTGEIDFPDVSDLITEDDSPDETEEVDIPDVSNLVTEDDTPVDNFASAKQQRLLVSSLYSALPEAVFLAEANVGIYHTVGQPPIVPDVFVSFDVEVPEDWWEKPNRCYLMWNFGKSPEIVIEIVSNQVGKELAKKLKTCEQMRVSYYALYDPSQQLGDSALRVFELRGSQYTELSESWLAQVNLGLTLWQGEFEGRQDAWLRWCNREGEVLLTGDERAEQATQRAEQERQRAEEANQRAEKLAAILRAQGIDPDQLS